MEIVLYLIAGMLGWFLLFAVIYFAVRAAILSTRPKVAPRREDDPPAKVWFNPS